MHSLLYNRMPPAVFSGHRSGAAHFSETSMLGRGVEWAEVGGGEPAFDRLGALEVADLDDAGLPVAGRCAAPFQDEAGPRALLVGCPQYPAVPSLGLRCWLSGIAPVRAHESSLEHMIDCHVPGSRQVEVAEGVFEGFGGGWVGYFAAHVYVLGDGDLGLA